MLNVQEKNVILRSYKKIILRVPPAHSGISGIQFPVLEQTAVITFCPLVSFWPDGHDTFNTVPGTLSVILTTRNNNFGHVTAAVYNKKLKSCSVILVFRYIHSFAGSLSHLDLLGTFPRKLYHTFKYQYSLYSVAFRPNLVQFFHKCFLPFGENHFRDFSIQFSSSQWKLSASIYKQ